MKWVQNMASTGIRTRDLPIQLFHYWIISISLPLLEQATIKIKDFYNVLNFESHSAKKGLLSVV